MMLDITMLTFVKILGSVIFLQTLIMPSCAVDITLSKPRLTIQAPIGEVYHITCQALGCEKPKFTWSSLMDQTLSGRVNTTGQKSILTMKISSESEGSYRCTVSCDRPPAERVFKVIPYYVPAEPVFNISSLIAEKWSRITCTVPGIYPSEMFTAKMYLGEKIVAEYVEKEMYAENISISHDFLLSEQYDRQEIRCLAELTFLDETIPPIEKQAAEILELLYAPKDVQIVASPSTVDTEVLLYCVVVCRSPVKRQWVKLGKDGQPVILTDTEMVTVSKTKPEDSGVYFCHVYNDAGNVSSHIVITEKAVPKKPTLTISPSTIAHIGQSVTIECAAAGDEDVKVTLWKVLKNGDMPLLEKAGSYVIKEASPMDAALYKCTAKNDYGVSEASESFRVEYPPVETLLSPSDVEVSEGDTVTLSCSSKGVPEPSFFLYHLLPSGESVLLSEGPEVTLTNVTSGVYQCEAINSLGTKKDNVEINVRYKPRNTFLRITPSLKVKKGDMVSIRCTSEAYPAPNLVLKKRTDMGLIKLDGEHGQYNITHVTREDQGEYICESSNIEGQQVAEAKLTVQVPPINTLITISPSRVMKEGQSGYIKCTSEAHPAPTLVLKKKTETHLIELELKNGHYHIENVESEHAGEYICESANEAGWQMASTLLTVLAPPTNTHIFITPTSLVTEGDEVQILCISQAFPTPRLVLKKKTELGLIDLLDSQDGLYNISHAGLQDIGTYICESTNGAGEQTAEAMLNVQIPSRITTVVTPSQNITATVSSINDTHIIPSPERQQSTTFHYLTPAIIGFVILISAAAVGFMIHYMKQARVKGSYSLVKAWRSKV